MSKENKEINKKTKEKIKSMQDMLLNKDSCKEIAKKLTLYISQSK